MTPLADQLDAFAGRLTALSATGSDEAAHSLEMVTTDLMQLARDVRTQEPAALALAAAAGVHQSIEGFKSQAEMFGDQHITPEIGLRIAQTQALASIAAVISASPTMAPAGGTMPPGVANGGLAAHLVDALEGAAARGDSPQAVLSAALLTWFTQVRA